MKGFDQMPKLKFVAPIFLFAIVHTAASSGETGAPVAMPAADSDSSRRVKTLLDKVQRTLRPFKGGTFMMGDWGTDSGAPYDIEADSRPVHKVTLDAFSMMAYKVTYDDFDTFTDASGNERIDMDPFGILARAPNRPAGVSWHGAKAYCQWLKESTNRPFDLPTEAQWEYAARSGGKKTLFATDNGKIERPRNFPKEWQHGEKEPPLPDVGSFPPNPAGLSGMSENVGEWVNDWYGENYYKVSPGRNPLGPESGTKKVKRGSVGGTAEIAAMVFMRTKGLPQPLRSTYPNGIEFENRVLVPYSGYSGRSIDTFRCTADFSPSQN
jgi:sulfatase modifying factor 1